MGALLSFFGRKPPETPIQGFGPRIKNIFRVHYRGLIGGILPFIILPILLEKDKPKTFVLALWYWMIWFFLWQPVNVPVTGLLPIFVLPLFGAMSTDKTCGCYMNEGILLFILANMILLLWNNSGLDRRLVLWFLCLGDTSQYSTNRLLFKTCTAGFFLSMFSNRLIVSSIMTQYMTPLMNNLQAATSRTSDPNYNELKFIMNNAIQTSCAIGSIGIIHSSFVTLTFRALFYQNAKKDLGWHDIFNYLEYTIFAFPLALVMLIANIVYHIIVVSVKAKTPMSQSAMNKAKYELENKKKEIPGKITLHEKLTLFFSILALFMFFFRWNKYLDGWSSFRSMNNLPRIRDSTVAALFVIFLHSFPSGFKFLKIFTTKKKSQLGKLKAESGVLWWRFVDKNINYGYYFVIGAGVALCASIRFTNLDDVVSESAFAKIFSGQNLPIYLLLVSALSAVVSNAMSGAAACVVIIPFVMNMHKPLAPPTLVLRRDDEGAPPSGDGGGAGAGANLAVFEKEYLGALAVGIGTNLGFMFPFLYTPAYFTYYTGKVPRNKMAAYGAGSSIVCLIVLWLGVAFYAPMLWSNASIGQELLPTTTGKAPSATSSAPD